MQMLLNEVVTQWSKITTFIQKFYSKLVDYAMFSSTHAWKLVGRCVGAIFNEMRSTRARIAMVDDFETPQNKAAIVWSVLQCHRIMKQFILLKFEGRPAIVRELSLFILTERVDPSEVISLKLKVTAAQERCVTVQSAVNKLTEQHNTLKRNFDNLAQELKVLKAKTK